MNKKMIHFLYIFLIISLIAFMIFCVWYLLGERQERGRNPFIYAASRSGNVQCSCVQDRVGLAPTKFEFNDTTFRILYSKGSAASYEINVTLLNELLNNAQK